MAYVAALLSLEVTQLLTDFTHGVGVYGWRFWGPKREALNPRCMGLGRRVYRVTAARPGNERERVRTAARPKLEGSEGSGLGLSGVGVQGFGFSCLRA